jgi:plasmid stabilization system protein ParE
LNRLNGQSSFALLGGAGKNLVSHNPLGANRFLDAVEQTVELLTRGPFIGHETGFRRALGFCSFSVRGYTKFLIFYKIRGREVIFGRRIHGARDPPTLLRKRQT